MTNTRTRIHLWLWDGRPEWLTQHLPHNAISRVICWIAGHETTMDHCLRPEHDHCEWCLKAMPGKAPRPANGDQR